MIRCVRLWTSEVGDSLFEEGEVECMPGASGDLSSGKVPAVSVAFQETGAGGSLAWHTAPARQFVVTLAGTLDFETRKGEHFTIHPGDVLLAEDTAGSGHHWRLLGEDPWRRVYVVLAPGAEVAFRRREQRPAGVTIRPSEEQEPDTSRSGS